MLNKVRIAVVVNEFGQWTAYGKWDARDDDAMNKASGDFPPDASIGCYIVEADVPLPKYDEIKGVMTEVESAVEVP